jgi:hypothetical protein
LTKKLCEDGGYTNAAMLRGIEMEPKAVAAYSALSGNEVRHVGFCEHDTLMAGCSPDGLIADQYGLLEVKCPQMATHLEYLEGGALPSAYVAQVTHNVWITDAQWCDFVSFDDRFPERLQVFHVRVNRSDLDIAGYEKAARTFLAEVDLKVAGLKGFSILEQTA